jgi:hypothetical protein
MKTLNLYKSQLDQRYLELTLSVNGDQPPKSVNLFEGEVDYDQLLRDILDSDVVNCWW